MPEKSVREMGELERLHHSLAARVFHAVMMGAAILGLVALLIGLGAYAYAMANQFIGESFGLARSTNAVLEKALDVEPLVMEVMDRYRSLSEEERNTMGEESYNEFFSGIEEREDYQTLRAILKIFLDSSDVNDVYLGVYDPDTKALVYICDPDDSEEYGFLPGEWEELEERELNKFITWDGEGKLHDTSNTDAYGWMCTSGMPVAISDKTVHCFVLSDITLSEIAGSLKHFILQYAVAIIIATVLLGVILTRHMKKNLVQPINAIAGAAEQYVADRKNGVEDTDHFTRLNIRTGDEIENLSLVFADMEKDLAEYEEHLTTITAEKERIGTELALATRLQADMLPNIFPAFPERVEFDIFAMMEPAKEVGGDFYDFFLIDDDHLGMVMADVSGKGVPAALFMMATKIILANLAMVGRSPKEVLEGANNAICANNREEMFVTVWFGILELSTGKVTAANAGHEYPVLKPAGGLYALYKDKHGFVIGSMEGLKYQQYELLLTPGARLFLYTDGVPEATNAENQMFGTERMLETLNAHAGASPEEALQAVRKAVSDFVGGAPQFDDLTMLCLEYKGPEKG